MEKIDFKKKYKNLYQVSNKEISQVDVPAFNFLMIDGKGDPNVSEEYAQTVEILFSVAYTAKFILKKSQNIDYAVMPLEGLWWADNMTVFEANNKKQWQWTMMIMQPSVVTNDIIEQAIAQVRIKKHLPLIDKLRFEEFNEGLCAQVLHVGPFSEEGPTIERLHKFIEAYSSLTGKHHEIYLSDIRRANPAKWKTIIRQPME